MITVKFCKNDEGQIFAFTVENHAKGEVCAAVSALTINTANGLEKFCEDSLRSSCNDLGRLDLVLPDGKTGTVSREAELLLESLFLGLYSIQEKYGGELEIRQIDVGQMAGRVDMTEVIFYD